jgi:AcrR family transcriptional regulator
MILNVQNPVPDLAVTIAQRSLADRGAAYAAEVRRLLDAGLELMRQAGTDSRPRVADIVAAAGLSNDAFYRHFPSKDAFVAALLEDGTQRLRSYLSHQMAKADTPEGQVRRWVEGVMSQAGDPEIAASKAVLWNGRSATDHLALAGPSTLLATLLEEPLAALGRADPALDAALVGHAVVGRMSEHLSHGTRPSRAEVARIVEFCVAR